MKSANPLLIHRFSDWRDWEYGATPSQRQEAILEETKLIKKAREEQIGQGKQKTTVPSESG